MNNLRFLRSWRQDGVGRPPRLLPMVYSTVSPPLNLQWLLVALPPLDPQLELGNLKVLPRRW
jgi:hypothetical protein